MARTQLAVKWGSEVQSEMKRRWGLELKGAEPDLIAWRMLLKPPFDPFVEEVMDERGDFLVLLASAFQQLTTPSEVHTVAKTLLKTLNVIMGKNADCDPLSAGAAVEFVADGPPRKHHVVEMEPLTVRMRVGLATITITDVHGKVIERKPMPSRSQAWMRAATLLPDIGAALRYLDGKPGWAELYKAYEAVRALPNGGIPNSEIKRFTHTANTEDRHHPTAKMQPHSRPMELWEARALITQWVSAAIDDVLAANPLPATGRSS